MDPLLDRAHDNTNTMSKLVWICQVGRKEPGAPSSSPSQEAGLQ